MKQGNALTLVHMKNVYIEDILYLLQYYLLKGSKADTTTYLSEKLQNLLTVVSPIVLLTH